MAENRYRVLAVCSHPVQYMSPILRRLSHEREIILQVAYCSLRGAESAHDPEFDTAVQWDVPLLDGYDWVEVPNLGSRGEGFWGLNNPGLWNLICRGNFDAVLCFIGYTCASFWIAYFATRRTHSAFLFGTDATSLGSCHSVNWKAGLKKRFWPRLFSLADQIVVCSSAGVDLMRSLGLPEDRITLTPFVVDNDWWIGQAARVNRSNVRKSWGITSDELIVLFCAKLQPWKRPLDLLCAFAAAGVPDSLLVFAGEGPLRAQLTNEAERLGVASRVRILGFINQSQLPAVYTAADLLVLPSGYDACPVVVCEAMLCGLPVLLSDEIRGRFDLVHSGLTGDIFPCGNVEALAAALRRLLTDRVRLAQLAMHARARMETWAPRNNITATIEAVSRAVQHRRSASVPRDSQISDSAISSRG
jgi:glycosyltransferase involved in cell wall biosynthesis